MSRSEFTDKRFTQTEQYISTTIDDEEVLLELDSEEYFGLNAVGADLWNQLAQPKSITDLKQYLITEYDVDAETAQNDVVSLIEDLNDADLIETRE